MSQDYEAVDSDFDFGTQNTRHGKHNYDVLLDGDPHKLVRGTHYDGKTSTMRVMLKGQAEKRGVSVLLKTVEDGLVCKAVPLSDNGEAPATKAGKKGKRASAAG